MSIPHRTSNMPAEPERVADSAPTRSPSTSAPVRTDPPSTSRVPRTRTGTAWLSICAATLAAVTLIVFMLQNTRSVEVNFLWMHGTLPLALALFIAGVGAVIVAMVVGTARIAQLRRLFTARAAQARGLNNNEHPTP